MPMLCPLLQLHILEDLGITCYRAL